VANAVVDPRTRKTAMTRAIILPFTKFLMSLIRCRRRPSPTEEAMAIALIEKEQKARQSLGPCRASCRGPRFL
jgi:hypothetical protein